MIERVISRSAVCPVPIGRELEVGELATNAASRRMTLIAGPAGIGKSRLSGEALRIADQLAYTSLVGYCTAEQATPYAPFVSALRRRTRTMSNEELTSLFDGTSLLAAALVPEAARAMGLPAEAPPQEDLFAAIWHLLRRLATPPGGIRLLEDLHWADTDSLRLLTYLARETDDLPLWIVGTYRRDEIHRRHPLAAVLADLGRERRYDEIVLDALSREDLLAMIAAILDGTDVGDEFADAMYERTAGNPFFVEELLKVLIERGDLYLESGDWARRELSEMEMPLTVRESLVARIRTLAPVAVDLLHLAALAGDRLDVAVLAAASGLLEANVDEVIADGLQLQLLAERHEGSRVVYAFRHALSREALNDELVGPDRRRRHLQLADAIATVHADHLDAHAAELADHFLAGGATARAIAFGRRAAAVAAASFAIDEAGRRYERTLSLMAPDDPDRLDVLLEAVTATIDTSDRRLGVAFATEARRLAHDTGDRASEGRAMSALAFDVSQAGNTPEAVAILREAVKVAEGSDDYEESMLRASLCRQLSRSDHVEEATALLPAAIDLAERSSNFRALTSLRVTAIMNTAFGPTFEASLDAAIDAARAGRDDRAEYGVMQTAGYICTWCGDFQRSQRSFQRALDLRDGVSPQDRYTDAGYAWLLSLMGEFAAAAERSVESRKDVSFPTRIVSLTALCEVAERTGSEDLASLVDELWSSSIRTRESQRSVPALAARARDTQRSDGVEAASGLFWEVLERTTTARRRGSHWMFSPDFARALLADERLDELERWTAAIGEVTSNDAHPHNRAADLLVRGYFETARGELASAREHFGGATALFGAMPCPAREAESLLGLAELERRAGDDDASELSARAAGVIGARIGAHQLTALANGALERASLPTVLATILFTDIVSSTERLSEVGDRAWRTILARHDAVVRRELEHFGGREINTTGDGFVATFDTPTTAIRCSLALRDALARVGVTIRAGLHTGECQVSGSNLTGLAVHVAARVCAAAAGSELLVTSTVRDLVAGTGLTFDDRGLRELKGVPGEWRLFAT